MVTDPHGVAFGARLLALEITIRLLVDEAGAVAPDFRKRVTATVERYLSGLDQTSDLERDFTAKARGFTEHLLLPPDSAAGDE